MIFSFKYPLWLPSSEKIFSCAESMLWMLMSTVLTSRKLAAFSWITSIIAFSWYKSVKTMSLHLRDPSRTILKMRMISFCFWYTIGAILTLKSNFVNIWVTIWPLTSDNYENCPGSIQNRPRVTSRKKIRQSAGCQRSDTQPAPWTCLNLCRLVLAPLSSIGQRSQSASRQFWDPVWAPQAVRTHERAGHWRTPKSGGGWARRGLKRRLGSMRPVPPSARRIFSGHR